MQKPLGTQSTQSASRLGQKGEIKMTVLEMQIIKAIQKARNVADKPQTQVETMAVIEKFLKERK